MSKLRVTTLATADDAYSVPAETLARGACRAWVNFDGTTTPPTIRASFNVSSVVRNGTGDYTINFVTALPDANYSVQGAAVNHFQDYRAVVPGTPMLIRIRTLTLGAGSPVNDGSVNVAIF